MGYRVIAEIAGYRTMPSAAPGHVHIADLDFFGFLANIDVPQFNRRFLQNIPERLQGSAVLARYVGISDPVTDVDPARSYRVRAATAHPVQEQQRIQTFAKLVEGAGPGSAPLLAELMRQSHQSYSAVGLGTEETDLIVELVRASEGLHGAKVSGAGGGGTVVVLGDRDADEQVNAVARAYESRTGNQACVLASSSEGASFWGTRRGQYRLGSWWLD
jgi:L-arabinokinase